MKVASVMVKSDQGNLKTDESIDGESRAQRKMCSDTRGVCRVVTLTQYHYEISKFVPLRRNRLKLSYPRFSGYAPLRCTNFLSGNLKSWSICTVWSILSWTVGTVGCATKLYNPSHSHFSFLFLREAFRSPESEFLKVFQALRIFRQDFSSSSPFRVIFDLVE